MPKAQTNETRLRQHDHHAIHYSAYQAGLHGELNQAKRLIKHLDAHPGDVCALAALKALPLDVLQQVPRALEMVRGHAGRA
jgi:hypothetical protein